jgi:hypothetical protein
VSIFFIVQNLFKKENRLTSLNSHYFFLFKIPRDAQSVMTLARQAFPGKSKYVTEVFAECTRELYSFMLMDLKQPTPESAHLVRNYASDDKEKEVFAPIV